MSNFCSMSLIQNLNSLPIHFSEGALVNAYCGETKAITFIWLILWFLTIWVSTPTYQLFHPYFYTPTKDLCFHWRFVFSVLVFKVSLSFSLLQLNTGEIYPLEFMFCPCNRHLFQSIAILCLAIPLRSDNWPKVNLIGG